MSVWSTARSEPQAVHPKRGRATARLLSAAAAIGVLALAGCGGSSESEGGSGGRSAGGTLRYGVNAKLDTLNPARDAVSGTTNIRYLTNETLIQKDPTTGEYGPGLATRFGFVGRDNLSYELGLRRDAVFSDGTPLTSDAVKRWLEYFARAGGGFATMLSFRSIETPDRWTVRLNFTAPSPNAPYFLAGGNNWGFVSSPRAVANPRLLAKGTYGVGPYVLDSSKTLAGDHYAFRPNPNYYDPSKAKWREVVVRVIPEPSTMLKAMQSGELDVATGDFATVSSAERMPDASVVSGVAGWDPILLLPRYARELGDVRVRQALNYAIDRRAITEAMIGRYGAPTSEWVTTDGFDPAYQNHYSYDPEKAKQLLAEAGYPDGFTLRVVSQGFNGNLGDPMVQVVADYLSRVGVRADIVKATSAGEHFEKGTSGEFGAWQFVLGSVPTATFLSLFSPEMGGQSDPVLDRLAARASTASPERAEELWKEFSRRTVTQASMLNVFTTPLLLYVSDDVTGVTVTPAYGVSPELLQWRPR